ncbi:MAG: vWA domain-containing protein [Burkholderiales bacterium]
MSAAQPWVLVLLPLALLPLLAGGNRLLVYSWLEPLPRDRVADALNWLLRLAACVALAAIILGLAGLYRSEAQVERIGRGAQIVVLLDRSRSMDESLFSSRRPEEYTPAFGGHRPDSKGKVARRLLADFAASRREDLFGMVVFSTYPMRVLDFTQQQEVIQAAIAATGSGRGLADTDIGRALEEALDYFSDRPYTGSRLILLVSDGGAQLDTDTRERLTRLMKRNRVALYWIYIRSFNSPGLLADKDAPEENADTIPEHFLHKFFSGVGVPYRAYEAENPEALARAIEDVNRLENLPHIYTDVLPRRELAGICYGVALALLLLLLGARLLEVRSWR